MTRKEQLEKAQKEAEAKAKAARKELAKIKREETRQAKLEAARKEQAHAMAFLQYCKGCMLRREDGTSVSAYNMMMARAKRDGIDVGGG